MILSGLWGFFVGITGVLKASFYTTVPNYTFNLSLHSWGWIHLVIGAVVFAAGVSLLLGMMWARIVGVMLAVLSGLANFIFLPHYPVWSIIVIALDVIIIWALTTSRGRLAGEPGGRLRPAARAFRRADDRISCRAAPRHQDGTQERTLTMNTPPGPPSMTVPGTR